MEAEKEEDRSIHIDSNNIRFSNSPARRTQILEVQSPTKSIHPEHNAMSGPIESIHKQADYGMRTTDFFDDESDEEDGLPRAITTDTFESTSRSRSPTKRKQMPPSGQSFVSRCEPKRVSMKALQPESEGYQRMDSNVEQQEPHPDMADTESYVGSVDEYLPQTSPDGTQLPKATARLSSTTRFRTSGLGWNAASQAANYQSVYGNNRASSLYSDKIEQRLGVHQMAYEMLIQNMIHDPELMSNKSATIKDQRVSMLPAALRTFDPRSPRDQLPANPSPERTSSHRSGQSRKKARFVPSPIDVGNTWVSLPSDIVRTPHPHYVRQLHRKDMHRSPPPIPESPGARQSSDSLLTLSIRRSNPNSRSRVTTLTIPASNDYSAIRTNEKGTTEQHTSSHNFDDQDLFHQIHRAYSSLASPFLRTFSARCLTRIVVCGPATRAPDVGHGWLLSPRSPRILAYQGLTDTFSEEKIMEMYRRPTKGKQRFAFVHWARRLAGSGQHHQSQQSSTNERHDEGDLDAEQQRQHSSHSPNDNDAVEDLIFRAEQPEGLEFIVSWSVSRILSALLAVLFLSFAACLLWIFLGNQTAPSEPFSLGSGGFRGAGDRVESGVLIGVLVLLVGLTGFGGWLGISWLVM
ncbi:hypothetical protein CERZMDRAFT_98607 [Cercospora zeae-maydis SCOH1-5]|uniref:Uncharacterized protein n=1 Tax=Cercospora zeae-maydis SCOH1-5 TaxID=717836 RepID=A0A6A6FD24_9PEZI|nr:hypothetical protein CERZMDRAFT_98607 [Cercospora zeae-maydis SCOH1-5]